MDINTASFFEYYYNHAEVNSIIIMDTDGIVLDINKAFTKNFGYNKEEIKGRNFNILFIQKDNEKEKPAQELATVLSTGQSHDENYVVNNNGHAIWCTGESVLAISKEGKKYIIKDIINLQARKHLHLFLKDTNDLLKRIFESSNEIAMLILDGSMKVQKVNTAFLQLFEIETMPAGGSRVSDLPHPFWSSHEIKMEIRKMLVDNQPLTSKKFHFTTKSGEQKTLMVNSKIIDRPTAMGRQFFLILEEVTS
jgi:PAS domain S-box-containing protein